MTTKRRFALLVISLVAIAAFYGGTRYQKHRETIGAFLQGIVVQPVRAAIGGANPTLIGPARHSWRARDTVLLPLRVDTVSFPSEMGVRPGQGGGLAVIGDTIVIVDLKGAFFRVEAQGDGITRLVLPKLPNNSEEWEQFGPKPVPYRIATSNTAFVVHDIEARREPKGIRLFVSFERYLRELNTTALAVSAISLGDDLSPLGPWEDIYQSQPLHAAAYFGIGGGGRMLALDDALYLTVGDYNQDNVFMESEVLEAQNPHSDFGKIFRIDLRTKAKTMVSMGHRNPQGLVVTSTGQVLSTEHGPRGGDLLNEIRPGRNFGWPLTTLGTHYTTYDWADLKLRKPEQTFDKPLFAFVPSIAPSNLIEIKDFDARWDGDLLVGSLTAKSLFRLRRDADGRVLYTEQIKLGQRLRDIASLPDGTPVIWTDDAQLLFVTVDRARLATNRR